MSAQGMITKRPPAGDQESLATMQTPPTKKLRTLKSLQPAPPRAATEPKRTNFYDLPAELRIEIYRLALSTVILHVLPLNASKRPVIHALLKTSRQVRNEVLPIIHRYCPIRAEITDLNFDGLLAFMQRIPPSDFGNLAKNGDLLVRLNTTSRATSGYNSLNRWLHIRADKCRPQPQWVYEGTLPDSKTANQLKRKCRRMVDENKQMEMAKMLEGMNVRILRDVNQIQAAKANARVEGQADEDGEGDSEEQVEQS
ncbi:hypothetical protein K431DRAFT_289010 [Polychaeton citri CBS 116435]|uniref:Uncharacterized protein n=1 Tax=Polychaeton citri CBS 116435 TaxID=1314669 RepID=A0A9P4UKM3_9PEZI|nr:hypothetical protein K431DRAFT_289010 [Polychaeton citri CBS 116435]